jgi:hypothetical protein
MLNRFISILMMFSALALMLGHNFIPHHHDFGHSEAAHHHHHHHHHQDGHHHDHDTNDESDDWSNPFWGIQHGAEGLTFLTSKNSADNCSKQIHQFAPLQISSFNCIPVLVDVRQNAPPYIADYYNSHSFLPSGLRAPPISIV